MIFVFLSEWLHLVWQSLRWMYVATHGIISFILWLSNIALNICTNLSYHIHLETRILLCSFSFIFLSPQKVISHTLPLSVLFFWGCLSLESLKISLWENHLLNVNIIQMHVSDNVVVKPFLVLSESCEIKHCSCRKCELSLIPILLLEGHVWTTVRSGLTRTLTTYHQLVGVPASLWWLWSTRFLQDTAFSPAISSSVAPFSSCPQSLPASGSFPMTQLFAWGGQSTEVSASASVLPRNTLDWSPLGWTG